MTEIRLTVNGVERELRVEGHHTLLRVLREQLGLHGAREGCGVGMCGACTVLLDGRPTSGCLLLAVQAQGREVVTIEGLGAPGALHPIQQAFVEETGFQCSFCTPGFVLTTKALLEEHPDASDEAVREYLAGNICRCGSYVKIAAAVSRARELLRAASIEEVE